MNLLRRESQITAIAALTEGCSIRAPERLIDTHRDTISVLALELAKAAPVRTTCRLWDLRAPIMEFDETWSYVGMKLSSSL